MKVKTLSKRAIEEIRLWHEAQHCRRLLMMMRDMPPNTAAEVYYGYRYDWLLTQRETLMENTA
tara:strand:- start:412 stop:600 length:189 start_codon:yes stop_codon:yes gene_type:complete